ncbi:MAG: 6-pyruvoyl-tetrahydropterin synthase-related protein [Thermodesulfobacteriota bacterium]
MQTEPAQPKSPLWIDIALMGLIFGFILTYIEPTYLFTSTITAGGDTASHYFTAQYLRDVLLPKGRISGWCMGNLAGFPMLQFYFPLPFLAMALLGSIIPLQIAFKLISVLGIFLLPPCIYFMFRLMRFSFPAPIVAAALSVLFLFNQGNSMWGANIPSTMAGEFCYSIGFSLTFLWLGFLWQSMTEERSLKPCMFLLAVIGLCHGYTLLSAGFFSLFFLLIPGRYGSHLKKLIQVHGSAVLLIAFWLFPLVAYLHYTTRFNFVWMFYNWRQAVQEILPVIFWPALLLSLAAVVGLIRQQFRVPSGWWKHPLAWMGYIVVLSVLLYFGGDRIGVVDIRFFPFMQCVAVISGAMVFSMVSLSPYQRSALAVSIVILALVWADMRTTYIRSWSRFNYSGFEQKPLWPVFSRVNDFLKGSEADPRVVYEHSMIHDRAGTSRAFESLPLFSGRSTLEGVYMQASPNNPFIFYIQSELSLAPSTPLPDYGYSRFDSFRGARHLRLFNVREYIVAEDKTRERVRACPEFETVFEELPYTVFRLKDRIDRYAVPLANKPILVSSRNWKTIAYRWFRLTDASVHLVFSDDPGELTSERFLRVPEVDFEKLPAEPVAAALPTKETVTEDAIDIEGATIGQPLLIKVSYHPGWRVEGADRIYLTTPAFMLVYPHASKVRLVYERPAAERIGIATTGCFVLFLLLFHTTFGQWVRSIALRIYCRWLLVLSLPAVAVILIVIGYHAIRMPPSPMVTYHKMLDRYAEKRYDVAREGFWAVQSDAPDSLVADQAAYHYGLCFFLENDWPNAIRAMNRLLRLYPDSVKVPEAYYHIGVSFQRMDRRDEARHWYEALLERFPDAQPWILQYVRDRLKELENG